MSQLAFVIAVILLLLQALEVSQLLTALPMAMISPRFAASRRRLLQFQLLAPLFYGAGPPQSSYRSFATSPVLESQDQHTAMPKFTYHAAASFSGKYKKFDKDAHVFNFNPYNRVISHKDRPKSARPASGQDAFFISRFGESNAIAFGVADGVGGWEESGVDPADFSHSLCDYMASAAYDYKPPNPHQPSLSARSIMQKGFDDVVADETIHAGGSTAITAIAHENGTMEVANLGDSGFVQLRLNAVHAYSEPQTHAFNTPYQLSVIPPSMLARAAAFGGAQLCDHPKDADVTSHNLKHGDILVFASDGLWDNLFNQDVLRIASKVMTSTGAWRHNGGGIRVVDDLMQYTQPATEPEEGKQQQRKVTLQSLLAVEITAAAKTASVDRNLDGPFAKEVQKYYPQEDWHGGKVDDICIVVVVVSEDGRGPVVKSKL
jgi:protein phosphatase PTC7